MRYLALLTLLPLTAFAFQSAPPKAKQPTYAKDVAPFVRKFCVTCHSGPTPADRIDLSQFKTEAEVVENIQLYKMAGREVKKKSMPPKGAMPMPTEAQRKAFMTWVESKSKK